MPVPKVQYLTVRSSTHHHITSYLAKGVDQMSVMIVVHLPQRGSHAGHEAPLEKRKRYFQCTIKFKLKAEDRKTLSLSFSLFLCDFDGC